MQPTPFPNASIMRTILCLALFFGSLLSAQAQLSVAYHQSSLPFTEVQVEIFLTIPFSGGDKQKPPVTINR